MMSSPAYNATPRTWQKGLTPPTDHQAQSLSQLKKEHHQQHQKQTYSPMQHKLFHRSKQSLQSPLIPGSLATNNLKFKKRPI